MTVRFCLFKVFILAGQLCYSQTYSSVIDDKEIYNFINSIIKTDKNRINKKAFRKISFSPKISNHWDSINFVRPNIAEDFQKQVLGEVDYIFMGKQDTLFNSNDRNFMFMQYKSIKDTVWHQSFSRAKFANNKKRNPDRYYFSVPIFSMDNKVAVIYLSNYCGNECGFGGYYIYKQESKNKWIFITAIGHWIS